MLYAALAAVLLAGYGIGNYRPGRRMSDWANMAWYDRSLRRTSPRWWARWLVLSVEDIGWLVAHPVQGWHAWQHRNDPPPPRSPAVRILRLPNHTVDEEA